MIASTLLAVSPLAPCSFFQAGNAMDQRYVDTVRACKILLRNMDRLDDTITAGQRAELNRLLNKVRERLDQFITAEETDLGLWVGE